MANSNVLDRQHIRQKYRNQRQMLSPLQQKEAASKILTTSLASTQLSQVNTVACYITNDSEIDPKAIINYCWQQGKRVLLPVLHAFTKGHLVFVEYHPNSPMGKNCYGIEEPIVTSKNLCPLPEIQLIFTPLVAFDDKGNRVGMGGGYYDRTLAPIRRDSLPIKLIGLAHDCQQAKSLHSDNWDIPLDGIATPTKFFNIS